MSETGWSDKRTDRLKELWADGWSASQIAKDLGHVSRSGVIGKVFRLGLSKRRTTVQTKRVRRATDLYRTRARSDGVPLLPLRAQTAGPVLDEAPMPEPAPAPPGAKLVRFLDRCSGECAWPLWSPGTPLAEMMCCGNECPPEPEAQSCGFHWRLAHGVGTPSERAAIRDAQKVAA